MSDGTTTNEESSAPEPPKKDSGKTSSLGGRLLPWVTMAGILCAGGWALYTHEWDEEPPEDELQMLEDIVQAAKDFQMEWIGTEAKVKDGSNGYQRIIDLYEPRFRNLVGVAARCGYICELPDDAPRADRDESLPCLLTYFANNIGGISSARDVTSAHDMCDQLIQLSLQRLRQHAFGIPEE